MNYLLILSNRTRTRTKLIDIFRFYHSCHFSKLCKEKICKINNEEGHNRIFDTFSITREGEEEESEKTKRKKISKEIIEIFIKTFVFDIILSKHFHR